MSEASNKAYLESIVAQFESVPRDAALAVAREIFQEVVSNTSVDSGQAALNWQYIPYKGQPVLEDQKILWGYGDVDPVAPAGRKWAGKLVDNSEAIYMYQFSYAIDQMASAPNDIDGVVVFNPITEGFASFAPGDDLFYPENAFKNVEIDQAISGALERVYADFNAQLKTST